MHEDILYQFGMVGDWAILTRSISRVVGPIKQKTGMRRGRGALLASFVSGYDTHNAKVSESGARQAGPSVTVTPYPDLRFGALNRTKAVHENG